MAIYGPYLNARDGRYYVIVNGKSISHARYIMEKHIGRKLERWEAVHHKDNNITNDEINNLEVIHSSLHTVIHNFGNKRAAGRRTPEVSWQKLKKMKLQDSK